MNHDPDRWECQECKAIVHESKFLRAPSPFDADDTLLACPECKAVDQWGEVCDEAGCNRAASCGFPDDAVRYRRTCYEHSSFNRDKGAA